MSFLPPSKTPLNQHSLAALEFWLRQLGATQSKDDPCLWKWNMNQCLAEISINQEELKIVWDQENHNKQFTFPYGLSRQDVESALMQGP